MTQTDSLLTPGSYRLRAVSPFSGEEWQTSASGLVLPVSAMPPRKQERPTCVSLFTGAGGFDLGFHRAGFRILAASDYNPDCAWTYGFNLGTRPMQFHFITAQDRERFVQRVVKPAKGKVRLSREDQVSFEREDGGPVEVEDATPHFFLGDVRRLTGKMVLDAIGKQMGEVDAVIGGPPCQGFSRAGRRDVMDPRNSLVFEFARLILEIRPKSMVMENVPDIISMITPEGIPVVDAFCKILEEGNYAGYAALKHALERQARSWGVLQNQGVASEKAKREADAPQGPGTAQLSLFAGEKEQQHE